MLGMILAQAVEAAQSLGLGGTVVYPYERVGLVKNVVKFCNQTSRNYVYYIVWGNTVV